MDLLPVSGIIFLSYGRSNHEKGRFHFNRMRVLCHQHDYEIRANVVSQTAVNLTRIRCAMVTKKEKNSDQDIEKL